MKTLVVPTDFSDCGNNDIQHYFDGTVGVWDMTPTKKRLFLFGGIERAEEGEVITGQYLTRQKEWRYKQLPLRDWNKVLKPILSRCISFNHEGIAAVLCPNRTKELKKGLKWNYSGIKWYGNHTDKPPTAATISYEAFKDLYVLPDKIYSPTLREVVDTGIGDRQSVCTHNGFVIDNIGCFWYRKTRLGVYGDQTRSIKLLPHATKAYGPYLQLHEDLKGRVE